MQHADIVAEFTIEPNTPLTHHGQPLDGLHLHRVGERELCYYASLELVERLDPHPNINTSNLVGGRWTHTLDEAVRTILSEATQ